MTRVSITTSALVAIAFVTVALTSTANSGPRESIEVTAAEAAAIRGGQCGSFQQITDGACTTTQDDTCTSTGTDCDGLCEYGCDSVNTYSGSGTFSGALIQNSCDPAVQPACTQTACTVGGVPVPCCQCLNGSNVQCGPAPYGLSPQGCSGT
jgi:hypothetical protein